MRNAVKMAQILRVCDITICVEEDRRLRLYASNRGDSTKEYFGSAMNMSALLSQIHRLIYPDQYKKKSLD